MISILSDFLFWSKKSGIWQAYLLDLVGFCQYAKNYQNISKGLSQTDSQGDYRALFKS